MLALGYAMKGLPTILPALTSNSLRQLMHREWSVTQLRCEAKQIDEGGQQRRYPHPPDI